MTDDLTPLPTPRGNTGVSTNASTVAWSLTAVTCFVLVVGVVVIRQVSDRPRPVHEVNPAESHAQMPMILIPDKAPLLVLRPEDPRVTLPNTAARPKTNPAESLLR